MVSVMEVEGTELLLESIRVCGNISRYPDVRDILVSNRGESVYVMWCCCLMGHLYVLVYLAISLHGIVVT